MRKLDSCYIWCSIELIVHHILFIHMCVQSFFAFEILLQFFYVIRPFGDFFFILQSLIKEKN